MQKYFKILDSITKQHDTYTIKYVAKNAVHPYPNEGPNQLETIYSFLKNKKLVNTDPGFNIYIIVDSVQMDDIKYPNYVKPVYPGTDYRGKEYAISCTYKLTMHLLFETLAGSTYSVPLPSGREIIFRETTIIYDYPERVANSVSGMVTDLNQWRDEKQRYLKMGWLPEVLRDHLSEYKKGK